MAGADLVITGGPVRTADAAGSVADAVAVTAGRITAVGTTAEVFAGADDATEIVDLDSRALYPGFVDVHNHHAVAGRTDLFELSLPPALGLDGILMRVARYADELADDAWIVGGSWASTLQNELSSTAVRKRLDRAAGGRPVSLSDDSHHNRWASSRALELAGIRAGTVPADGVTVLDAVDGSPTGVLLEAAGIPVEQAARTSLGQSAADHRRASARGIELLHTHGVTAFQDAAVSVDILAALAALDADGELDAWVVTSLLINDDIFGFEPVGEDLLALGERYRSPHHRPDFVKIFLDGVPPAHTAAFLDPYPADEVHGAGFRGETTMTAEALYGWLRLVASRGLGAKVHCTGDGSAHVLLDAVERLRAHGFADTAVQLAHGQFLADGDIERMARLGVAADISPFLWFPGVIPDALAAVLGAERAARSQPNRALVDVGVVVAGGSDWPVSDSPNPLEGIQGLVTRADPLGRAPGTLWPEQALTAEEALRVFTADAARAMGLAGVAGSIEVGGSADFALLSHDAIAGPPEEIVAARVEETWFAGRRVYVA